MQKSNSHIIFVLMWLSQKGFCAYSKRCSQAVTHPSTDRSRRCLTSVIGREPVHSTWCGRRHQQCENEHRTISRFGVRFLVSELHWADISTLHNIVFYCTNMLFSNFWPYLTFDPDWKWLRLKLKNRALTLQNDLESASSTCVMGQIDASNAAILVLIYCFLFNHYKI
jgi:hypothetical protein